MKAIHLLESPSLTHNGRGSDIISHDDNYNYKSNKIAVSDKYMLAAYGDNLGRDLLVIGRPQTLEQWHELMRNSNASYYNEFNADIVAEWFSENLDPEELKHFAFLPARDNSIALYIISDDDNMLRDLVTKLKSWRVLGSTRSFHVKPNEIDFGPVSKFAVKRDRENVWNSKPNPGWKTIGKNRNAIRLWWS